MERKMFLISRYISNPELPDVRRIIVIGDLHGD